MASTSKKVCVTQAVTANVIGEKVAISQKAKSFIGLNRISDYVAGNFTAKIQHSPNGTDWFDLKAFTAALAANGSEIQQITDSVFENIRGHIATAAGPNATVEVELHYEEGR